MRSVQPPTLCSVTQNSLPIETLDVWPTDSRAMRLLEVFRKRRGSTIMTAFSGGIDSTLVAAAARRVLGRDAAPAAVGDSRSLPRRELAEVRQLAQQLDLHLIEVQPGEQLDPDYQKNAGDRCYFCKTHLYDTLQQTARQLDIATIANGTNLDDQGDYRPGLRAADEADVISPLVEAQLTKDDVRDVARLLGLPNWDKPAAACLASRLPYGTPVTAERLEQVERAENALADLGFSGFRVRHHEDVARLEVPVDQLGNMLAADMRQRVVDSVKAAGYVYVSLDLEGFRSGSGNVTLTVGGA